MFTQANLSIYLALMGSSSVGRVLLILVQVLVSFMFSCQNYTQKLGEVQKEEMAIGRYLFCDFR